MPDDLLSPASTPAVDNRQNVKSLFKMLDVLECFSAVDRALTVIEMARRTNLPLYREARPYVDTLARLSGEDVHLCVFDGSQMVFVERAERDAGRLHNTVTRMEASPCHSTGVGKAALAFQPEVAVERVVRLGLRPFTRNTIVDAGALRRELGAIRARGYSVDNCEHEPDLRCVGAPIRNAAGRVFAAISASGAARRVPEERILPLAELVVAHAKAISAKLGDPAELAVPRG